MTHAPAVTHSAASRRGRECRGRTPLRMFRSQATSDSVKFAVIGDTGTGAAPQFAIGRQMADARAPFPFDFVIMLGDNMYGSQDSRDFVEKFERPYASLLQAGVKFYASLGNHDNQTNRFYKSFNMDGERYYTFARGNVRFFAFDTNLLDQAQLAWIEEALKQSQAEWKICFFHHPLYSMPAVMAGTSPCASRSNRCS